MLKKAVFFDRDGVLIEDKKYNCDPKKIIWIDKSIQAIKYLNKIGVLVVVITNQSGIGRGFFDCKDVENFHFKMNLELLKFNAKIDRFYFCSYFYKSENLNIVKEKFNRKPFIGMLKKASRQLNIDLKKSFMIGDKVSDFQCAKNINMRFIFKKKIPLIHQLYFL